MATFSVTITFDADHESGTKFYQVIKIVKQEGVRLTSGVIGHYGKVSLRSGIALRFRGQRKVYGTAKEATNLSSEKRKGGYTNQRSPQDIGTWPTQGEMIDALAKLGLDLTEGEIQQLGLKVDLSKVLPTAIQDPTLAVPDQPPVTAQRKAAGALATTSAENPWAGTW